MATLLSGCASISSSSGSGGWVTIQRGDTMHRLANRYGIPVLRLQRFNPGINARDMKVGQRLMMPSRQERAPGSGTYRYQIRPGDTFGRIAAHFNTSAAAISQSNRQVNPRTLQVGRLISVPVSASTRVAAAPRSRPSNITLPASAHNWPWPLRDGRVTREFGEDARGTLQPMMLLAGNDRTARAVSAGVVKFAGNMRQLGNVVIIHHASNMQTVFAYCGTPDVREGQQVMPGTPVCRVAPREQASQHALLFDIRKAGHPVDPRRVLK
nr:M23 family metallopeptidase [Larsenimonas rhizosphaerae]